MERFLTVAGGQLGPIARHESRQQVVWRLVELMRDAKARGSDIVVFPELALTTFFPRWWMEDEAETDSLSNTKWRVRQLGRCSKPRNYAGSVSISVMPNWRRKTAPRAKRIVYDFRRCFKKAWSQRDISRHKANLSVPEGRYLLSLAANVC
jgi:predicted amidohydrolase